MSCAGGSSVPSEVIGTFRWWIRPAWASFPQDRSAMFAIQITPRSLLRCWHCLSSIRLGLPPSSVRSRTSPFSPCACPPKSAFFSPIRSIRPAWPINRDSFPVFSEKTKNFFPPASHACCICLAHLRHVPRANNHGWQRFRVHRGARAEGRLPLALCAEVPGSPGKIFLLDFRASRRSVWLYGQGGELSF